MQEEYSALDYLSKKVVEPTLCEICDELFIPDAPGLRFCSIDCYEQSKTKKQSKSKRIKYKRNETRPKPSKPTPEPIIDDHSYDDAQLWTERMRYWEGKQGDTSFT